MRTAQEGMEFAKECWEKKFNCAESVLRGVCHAQGLALPDLAMRMATPFGGGVGRSEDICGALSGGVLAIGAVKGRTDPDDDRLRSYDAAASLYGSFMQQFGASSCSALNKGDFKSPEHRVRCGRFVEGATRLAIAVLREK